MMYLRFKTGLGRKQLSPTYRTIILPVLLLRTRDADFKICIGLVTDIVGVPKAEAYAIICYLSELTTATQEIPVRFQWRKNDVALWDNRIFVSVTRLSVCAQ